MKPAQLGSLNAELPPLEEDLAARLESIFERCPQLHGFTVQDSSALPEELRSLALEKELVVTDIGVYPFINAEQCEAIYTRSRWRCSTSCTSARRRKTPCAAGRSRAPCTEIRGLSPN